jgi:hypothetical protein
MFPNSVRRSGPADLEGMNRTASHKPGKYARRSYVADEGLTCRICVQPIEVGSRYWIDLTKSTFHPVCKRIGLKPSPAVQTSRYLNDPDVGKHCAGCGWEIGPDEKILYVVTLPWHAECRQRR